MAPIYEFESRTNQLSTATNILEWGSLTSRPPPQSRNPGSPHSKRRPDRCPIKFCNWGALLAGLCLLALGAPRLVEAHGWLEVPASRNFLATGRQNNFWEPMSLNKMGSVGGGVCGGLYNGDPSFSAGGQFASNAITGAFVEGETIDVTIHIFNNHWGKFQMRLCPLSDSSAATEAAELSDACLDQNLLQLADGTGLWTYLLGARSADMILNRQYRLPPGVKCERCILQWRWVTGHSCIVPGMDWNFAVNNIMPIPHYCDADYLNPNSLLPEKFWNCADIKITGSGGSPVAAAAPDSVMQPIRATTKSTSTSPAQSSGCQDLAPPGSPITCAEQKLLGKCGQPWMVGYCALTCGTCPNASAEPLATASGGSGSAVTVAKFWQCGGQYGGPECQGQQGDAVRCPDSAWPEHTCINSSCTRINAAYWQCR